MIPSSLRLIGAAFVALLLIPLGAASQQEQQLGPFDVLIPDFEALEDADRRFGRDVAKELRELMSRMPTHRAIDRDDIEDALDDLDLDMEDMTCVLTRQLATRIDARVALCAEYTETADDTYTVRAVFWDIPSGEYFEIEPTSGTRREAEAVAATMIGSFERYTAQVRAAANCEAFAASSLWDRALSNCDEALAINENAIGARHRRARILMEMDRLEESIAELQRVLEQEPTHEAALQLAGFVAGSLGRTAEAVDYYSRYLQFSPTAADVRMRVAYDLAQAGDAEGAMQLIQQGLDLDPENIDLWEQFGGYAFAVADRINREAEEQGDAGGVAPGARPLFVEAIAAYRRVYEARGAETDARHLRSIVVAYLRLGDVPMAVSMASEAIEIHPDDETIWSVYADAMWRDDQIDAALEALDRLEALNPEYPRLGLRRGNWLIGARRIDEAVEALSGVAEADPTQADAAARVVLVDAHANGVEAEEYAYAIAALDAVSGLPNLSEGMRHQLNFWHGYSRLQRGIPLQEERSLESARATLPEFQRARELLLETGDYPAGVGVNIQQLIDAVDTYIEIQEAIIRRGR